MSYIDNTWVAFSFDEPVAPERIGRSLERVGSHYRELCADPVRHHAHVTSTLGMAIWRRDDPRLRWPHWTEDGGTMVASTNAVTGWQEVGGEVDVARAPL